MALAGFNNYFKLTIDNSKIDEDLTNFPVSITLSSGTGQTGFDATDVFTELTTVESGTSLLLHMNGDASDNHQFNCQGTPQINPPTIISGFNSLGYMEFDGSSDYLTVSYSSDFDLGTTWTVEAWVYARSEGGMSKKLLSTRGPNGDGWEMCIQHTSNYFSFAGYGVNNTSGQILSANTFPIENWYHVAIVTTGGYTKLYVDGVEEASYANAYTWSAGGHNLYIGNPQSFAEPFLGYFTELRISKGIARWTTDFSEDLPTSPYETDSYTKLLAHFDGDRSDSGHLITFNGNPQIYSSTGKFGGSYRFDGTGDYLTVLDSDVWSTGSEDFTIEFWVYYPSVVNSCDFVGQYIDDNNRWKFYLSSDGVLRFYVRDGGVDRITYGTSGHGMTTNTWYHLAIVRNGTSFVTYVDGVNFSSTTSSYTLLNLATSLQIGYVGGYYSNMYMSELNILKGVAKYTSNFTVPQGPPGSSWDNRKKIAITDSDNNQLYTEIERWDYANEEATLWVKVPTIVSGTDTNLYLYYDATTSGNTTYVGDTGESPAQSVWDSNFMGVWHMSQDPSGGSGAILDSTSNVHHGTSSGTMLTEDLVDGKIGKAIDFDGNDDEINVGTDASLDLTSAFTYETIFKTTWSGNAQDFVAKFDQNGLDYQFEVHITTNGGVASNVYDNDLVNINANTNNGLGGNFLDGNYHYVATNIDITSGDGKNRLFTDGVLNVTSSTAASTINSLSSIPTTIGERYNNTVNLHMYGILDEIRISNIKRSDTWIKTTYYSNWNDLVTFSELTTFTFSSPIPIPLSTVYGVAHQLQLTTTITGNESSYIYDATFYDASDDGQIGPTISGTPGGQYVSTIMSTPSATDYSWYIVATSSGQSDTSSTYAYSNRFMCSGYTQVAGTGTSGIPVRLYRRSNGEYVGGAISSGVSGTFDIITDYNEYHYAVALYSTDDTNALIADWLKPDN